MNNVGEATRYSLRNNRDIQQFNCRLSIMKTSFFPSTIDKWNNLPIDIRNSTSLLSFKRKLNSLSPQTCPQKYYNNGQRQLNIIHARLRRECSSLNADLYKINLSDTYLCRCGSGVENAKHYFLECELHDNIRPSLLRTIAHNGGRCDIKTILYGNPSLNFDRNQRIFKAVHTYIKQSNRFWHGRAELELNVYKHDPPPSHHALTPPAFPLLSGPAHYFYTLTIYVTLYLALLILFYLLFTYLPHPPLLLCL